MKKANTGVPDLMQQVVGRLGPEGVWKELSSFIPSLQRPRNGSPEVLALCPFHDDRRPSWCWNLQKGVATCHVCAGEGDFSMIGYIAKCTDRRGVVVLDEYCKRLDLPRPRSKTLTLVEYAGAKMLSADFLTKQFSLSDVSGGMRIPYLDRDGSVIAERIRRKLREQPRWKKGARAMALIYGLHGIENVERDRVVFLFEGESDLHTAWHYGLPSLAVPGATMGIKTFVAEVVAAEVETVFTVPDADKAGQNMLRKIDRALAVAGWAGDHRCIQLPAKDLSALHIERCGDCRDAISAEKARATPARDAIAQFERCVDEEAKTFSEITGRILKLESGDANATDKVILIATARTVATNPTGPIPCSRKALGRKAHVPRRTLFSRLSGLIERRLLEEVGDALRLGKRLVQ